MTDNGGSHNPPGSSSRSQQECIRAHDDQQRVLNKRPRTTAKALTQENEATNGRAPVIKAKAGNKDTHQGCRKWDPVGPDNTYLVGQNEISTCVIFLLYYYIIL